MTVFYSNLILFSHFQHIVFEAICLQYCQNSIKRSFEVVRNCCQKFILVIVESFEFILKFYFHRYIVKYDHDGKLVAPVAVSPAQVIKTLFLLIRQNHFARVGLTNLTVVKISINNLDTLTLLQLLHHHLIKVLFADFDFFKH
jgi:hypothetical protein